MRLAVIPARGGSKRIPKKNIRDFCGRPIIEWTIKTVIASDCFDRIIVSTDDEEIAEIGRNCGAEVPFLRPQDLSNDFVGTMPVIQHAINWAQLHGGFPDLVCCIYATAPLLLPDDIRSGLQSLESCGAEFSFSVSQYCSPIQRALRINSNNRLEMFHEEYVNFRSQDLEDTFHDAGQFYWGRVNAWLSGSSILNSEYAVPIILPHQRVQDIDSIEDWEIAEIKFNLLEKRSEILE